jgi:hypothetical protein
VESWKVQEEVTVSDHRNISYSIDIGEIGSNQDGERRRVMMVHQADWDRIREIASEGRGTIPVVGAAEDAASSPTGTGK